MLKVFYFIEEPKKTGVSISQDQLKPAAKDLLQDIDLADQKGVNLEVPNLFPPKLAETTHGTVKQTSLRKQKPKKAKGKRKGNGKLSRPKKIWRPMSHKKQQKAKGSKKLSKRKGSRKQGRKSRQNRRKFSTGLTGPNTRKVSTKQIKDELTSLSAGKSRKTTKSVSGRKSGKNKRRPKMLRFPGKRRQTKRPSKGNKPALRKLRNRNRKTGSRKLAGSFGSLKSRGKPKRKLKQGKKSTGKISRKKQWEVSPKTVSTNPIVKV